MTELVFILDRSGSMAGLEADTIGGFNSMIARPKQAAGEALVDAVERIKTITGRIDLVHCNDSRDAAGSGADRHANFDAGTFDSELIAAVCRDAGCDVIIETPSDGHLTDLAFLRKRLRKN